MNSANANGNANSNGNGNGNSSANHHHNHNRDDHEDRSRAMFVISVAAELSGMHAQTLRTYDRLGLVTPERTSGGGRRYSHSDIDLLRKIQTLSQEAGVNLAGIREILALTQKVEALSRENDRLRQENSSLKKRVAQNTKRQTSGEIVQVPPAGEVVHVPRSTAVVMWKPRRRRHDR